MFKIGLPGKSILRDYYQENMTSRRPFLSLRISFPGRPIFIQFIPDVEDDEDPHGKEEEDERGELVHRIVLKNDERRG